MQTSADAVEVEFLGVARLLARRARVQLPVSGPASRQAVLRLLAREAPALIGTVLTADGALLGGHVLSRHTGGALTDPAEPVQPGERLLLLDLSAGG